MGKFGSKKLKLSVLPENWHTCFLEGADSYSDISCLNFKTQIYFWASVGQKSQSCLFCLKTDVHDPEDTDSYAEINFVNFKPKFIFGQS